MSVLLFCGMGISGYKHSLDNTPVVTGSVEYVSVANGIFDRMYMTRNTGEQAEEFPGWDYDTIMDAEFNGNLVAGNISYMIDQIDAIRVKRRRASEYNWITLYEVPISVTEDLQFERYDRYVANAVQYEYALAPVIGSQEGYVNKNSITPEFDGCFLYEKENGYVTDLEISKGTITRNKETSVVTTLESKYPYVISNGAANYDSGSFSMMFLPKDDTKEYTTDGAYSYREEVKQFLNDGRPKIMKLTDGRTWMIMVEGSIAEDNDSIENVVHTSFDWVEIGDPESSSDLYENNFIDVNLEG